jgi:hypothetical protein
MAVRARPNVAASRIETVRVVKRVRRIESRAAGSTTAAHVATIGRTVFLHLL